MKYDIVVAGGSIAGLLCAREAARNGCSVLVIEKSHEIGTPQHCGGLVSRKGLDALGIVPTVRIAGNEITSARLIAPRGHVVEVSQEGNIIEVDRRNLDKYVAEQAQRAGAQIRTGVSFRGFDDHTVTTSMGSFSADVLVDARGIAALVNRSDILPSVQCEIHSDHIKRGIVEVMLDNSRWPGFFAWVIPSRDGMGKVGVAGRGIDVHRAINNLLESWGRYSVLRRISAPIWVGGPAMPFTQDMTVKVGDAAGQTKPTTGGGIYSGGMGGVMAGQSAAKYCDTGDLRYLDYTKRWLALFGQEFDMQSAARRMLERLDNQAIDQIVASIKPDAVQKAAQGNFDFHAGSILSLLGLRGAVTATAAVTASEMRHLARTIASFRRGN